MSALQIWNSYMSGYDFLNEVDSYSESLQDILKAADVAPGFHVLDAGSGTGNLSCLLKKQRAIVTSCDIAETAIAAHLQKDPDANVFKMSLEQPFPFDSARFDVICCASVLFA